MRATKIIHVISAHAEGEVGGVIVGGVAPPPGDPWPGGYRLTDTRGARG